MLVMRVYVNTHSLIYTGYSPADMRCCAAAQRDSSDPRAWETSALAGRAGLANHKGWQLPWWQCPCSAKGMSKPPSKGNPNHPQSLSEMKRMEWGGGGSGSEWRNEDRWGVKMLLMALCSLADLYQTHLITFWCSFTLTTTYPLLSCSTRSKVPITKRVKPLVQHL